MSKYKRGQHPNSRKNLEKGHRFTEEIATEKGRKGAEQSHKAQKETRTVRAILTGIIEQPAETFTHTKRLAEYIGLDSKKSIKEVMTFASLMAETRRENFGIASLEKLMELIGENIEEEQTVEDLTPLARLLGIDESDTDD